MGYKETPQQKVRRLQKKVKILKLKIGIMRHFVPEKRMREVEEKVREAFSNTFDGDESHGMEMIQDRLDRY